MSNQEMRIASAAAELVDAANEGVLPARMVSKGVTREIIRRSMTTTEGMPFSLREHLALRDVSSYISVCQTGKSNAKTLSNTDLLPLCNPLSTKINAMSRAAMAQAQARWISADPDITDDSARALVAAAYVAVPGTDEHTYFTNRIAALPAGTVPLRAITAAFGDGNSRAARSARARMQKRDNKGRFAWMGGGMRALVRRANGGVFSFGGRLVGQGDDSRGGFFDVELDNGQLKRIPAVAGEASKGWLPDTDGVGDGFAGSPAKVRASDAIISEADIQSIDAPNGFSKDENYSGPGERFSDDAYEVIKFDPNDDAAPEKLWNGKRIDFDKPLYVLRREGAEPSELDFAAQAWADVQDYIRRDEVDLDREEGRTPDAIAVLDDDQIAQLYDAVGDRDPYEVARELFGGQEEAPETEQPETAAEAFEFPNAPEGAYLFDVFNPNYTPKGRTDQDSEDYTDDPEELANRNDISDDDLLEALRAGVMPQKGSEATGEGPLQFEAGFENVPVEAIVEAMRNRGLTPEMAIAEMFDEGRSDQPNVEAVIDFLNPSDGDADAPESSAPKKKIWLDGRDKEPKKKIWLDDENKEPKKKIWLDGREDGAPVKLPALLDGLSEEEQNKISDTGDYKPYLPSNDDFESAPGGYYVPDPEPFENVDEDPAVDPIRLATEVEQPDLEDALREAIEPGAQIPGYGTINEVDSDGEENAISVPAEASRDALQLQGADTNKVIGEIYGEAGGDGAELDDSEAGEIMDAILESPEEPVSEANAAERSEAADIAKDFGYTEEAQDLIRNGGSYDEIMAALKGQVEKPKGVMFPKEGFVPYDEDYADWEARNFAEDRGRGRQEKWDKFGRLQDVLDRIKSQGADQDEIADMPERTMEPDDLGPSTEVSLSNTDEGVVAKAPNGDEWKFLLSDTDDGKVALIVEAANGNRLVLGTDSDRAAMEGLRDRWADLVRNAEINPNVDFAIRDNIDPERIPTDPNKIDVYDTVQSVQAADGKNYEIEVAGPNTDGDHPVIFRTEDGREVVLGAWRYMDALKHRQDIAKAVASENFNPDGFIDPVESPDIEINVEPLIEAPKLSADLPIRKRFFRDKGRGGKAARGERQEIPKNLLLRLLRFNRKKVYKGRGDALDEARDMLIKFDAMWDDRGIQRPRPEHRVVQREDYVEDDEKYVDINGNVVRVGDIVAHNRDGELVNPEGEPVNVIKGRVLYRDDYERGGVTYPGGIYLEVLEADDDRWVGRTFFYVARLAEIIEQPDLKDQIMADDAENASAEEVFRQKLWRLSDRELYLNYFGMHEAGEFGYRDMIGRELAIRNRLVPFDMAEYLDLLDDSALESLSDNMGLGQGVHGEVLDLLVAHEKNRRAEGIGGRKKVSLPAMPMVPEDPDRYAIENLPTYVRPKAPEVSESAEPAAPARKADRPAPAPEAPAEAESEAPVGEGIAPEEAVAQIVDAVDAGVRGLRADPRDNDAKAKGRDLMAIGDDLEDLLNGIESEEDRDSRDNRLNMAEGLAEKISAISPLLGEQVSNLIKEMRLRFNRQDFSSFVDQKLAEAEKLNAGDAYDPEARDRLIAEAEDHANKFGNDFPDLKASALQRIDDLKKAAAKEDGDRRPVEPQGRTEAVDEFDQLLEQKRQDLRANGEKAKALDLVDEADRVTTAINNAEYLHKLGDKAGRDSALDAARAAVEDLRAIDSELADVAAQAIERNAARFAQDDSPADAVPSAVNTSARNRAFNKAANAVRKIKAALPKLKDVAGVERKGIQSIHKALKALNAGDFEQFESYASHAERVLGRYNLYPKELADLQAVRDELRSVFNGNVPDLAEIDVLAVREDRISKGENVLEISNEALSFFAAEDFAMFNPDHQPYVQEIQDYFSGDPKPMAVLSPEARFVLRQYLRGALSQQYKFNMGPTKYRDMLDDVAKVLVGLHRERAAYEPPITALSPSGKFLLTVPLSDFEQSVRKGVLTVNGQVTDYKIKRSSSGGGAKGRNATYILTDTNTGEMFFVKKDTTPELAQAEVSGAELARAMGMLGGYYAEMHDTEEKVVVMAQAGKNLDRRGDVLEAADWTHYETEFAEGNLLQAAMMVVQDAALGNGDRHMRNYMGIQDRDPITGEEAGLMPIAIDNGLAAALNQDGRDYSSTIARATAVQYIQKNLGKSDIGYYLKKNIGQLAFAALVHASALQAAQELRRQYPPGKAPSIDILVDRLESIAAAPASELF